jgi:hypothetical protein
LVKLLIKYYLKRMDFHIIETIVIAPAKRR